MAANPTATERPVRLGLPEWRASAVRSGRRAGWRRRDRAGRGPGLGRAAAGAAHRRRRHRRPRVLALALARYETTVVLGVALLAVVKVDPAPADAILLVAMLVALATGRFDLARVPTAMVVFVSGARAERDLDGRGDRPPSRLRVPGHHGVPGALRPVVQHVRRLDAPCTWRPAGVHLAPAGTLLIPVPLHSSKLRSRRFNQSELIAEAALKGNLDLRLLKLRPQLLKRVRATESQTGLTREQRRENIRGAFAVTLKDEVRARDILVVDDVLTTGTTVGECARVLRNAGAARVWIATVARVMRPCRR